MTKQKRKRISSGHKRMELAIENAAKSINASSRTSKEPRVRDAPGMCAKQAEGVRSDPSFT